MTVSPTTSRKPVTTFLAFDAGRTVLVSPSRSFHCLGKRYRDVSLKGVGPIQPFVGFHNILNMAERDGLLTLGEAYSDLARSNILRGIGIRVPLGVCIIDTGMEFTSIMHKQKPEAWKGKSAIYVRAFTVNTRLISLTRTSASSLRQYLALELAHLSILEGIDLTHYSTYLRWFAKHLAVQAAKLQRVGYLHDALHAQQICIDGTICDFEHEFGSGFLENPQPNSCYLPGSHYTMGDQPTTFSKFVAHEDTGDNLWQILKPIAGKTLINKDTLLEYYWETFNSTLLEWECPSLDEQITLYGLNMDEETSRPFFQDGLAQVKFTWTPPQWWMIKQQRKNPCH